MPTTKVTDIIQRCKSVLFDALQVRWSDAELLDWFNAGQVHLVSIRPDANTKRADHTCTLGTEQTLLAEGLRLIRVVRDVGGSAIRFMDMDQLDSQIPDWHDDSSPVTDCEFYTYSDKDPRRFYLYPAPEVGHKVVHIYSAKPALIEIADFGADTTPITLPDTYADPLVDYVLYRAFSKDSDFANGARAQAHYQAMMQAIQGKTEADGGMSPANG